jgi:hypothetical protein
MTTISFAKCANAERSGILLGLRYEVQINQKAIIKGYETPSFRYAYRTLYIYPVAGSFNVIEGPEIIVPRDNGFYKAGIISKRIKDWYEEQFYIIPVDGNLQFKVSNEVNPDETNGAVYTDLLFVSNNFCSLKGFSQGYTQHAAHPWYFHSLEVRSFDAPENYTKIQNVLGPEALKAMNKSAMKYYKTRKDREYLQEVSDDNNWGLARSGGHWVIRSLLNHSCEACRGSYGYFTVDYPAPKKLTSWDTLKPTWNEIRKKFPTATDAFSSPSSDFIGIMTSGNLNIYKTDYNGIADFREPLKTIKLKKNESIVMAQWATGNYVDKWAKVMMQLFGR